MTSNSYVTTLNLKIADKLLEELKNQGFEISNPTYTVFSAKKKGLNCTLYTSGKLVVQGKECAQFVEFFLEPEILKTFNYTHPLADLNISPHIGIDESGKGDFFGPLCIAGVYVKENEFALLQSIGVKDSKTISDSTIRKLAKQIKEHCEHHIVKINPAKYNEIYPDFKNLNRLLAWGHATTIEQLVQRSHCRDVIIDQFADESVVKLALKRKKLEVNLSQRHRAEDDLAVAAASILARATFVESLDRMSEELGIQIPKGSSKTAESAAKEVIKRWGIDKLKQICKQHFKTLDAILSKEDKV